MIDNELNNDVYLQLENDQNDDDIDNFISRIEESCIAMAAPSDGNESSDPFVLPWGESEPQGTTRDDIALPDDGRETLNPFNNLTDESDPQGRNGSDGSESLNPFSLVRNSEAGPDLASQADASSRSMSTNSNRPNYGKLQSPTKRGKDAKAAKFKIDGEPGMSANTESVPMSMREKRRIRNARTAREHRKKLNDTLTGLKQQVEVRNTTIQKLRNTLGQIQREIVPLQTMMVSIRNNVDHATFQSAMSQFNADHKRSLEDQANYVIDCNNLQFSELSPCFGESDGLTPEPFATEMDANVMGANEMSGDAFTHACKYNESSTVITDISTYHTKYHTKNKYSPPEASSLNFGSGIF